MSIPDPVVIALIGVASACIGLFGSMYLSRKSKYVETITVERIKWIGITRSDLAKLTNLLLRYQKAHAQYTESREFTDLARDHEYQSNSTFSKRSNLNLELQERETEEKRVILNDSSNANEIIELACLLKLKFNPVDDADIILHLNTVISSVSERNASIHDVNIMHIVDCSQLVLKREWDKVKSEAKAWVI
jgi:hypothetical protein